MRKQSCNETALRRNKRLAFRVVGHEMPCMVDHMVVWNTNSRSENVRHRERAAFTGKMGLLDSHLYNRPLNHELLDTVSQGRSAEFTGQMFS